MNSSTELKPATAYRGEVGVLRNYLNAVLAVGDEVKMTGDGTKLSVTAVDPAHVIMGVFELACECEEFEANVPIPKLMQKLKGFSANDTVLAEVIGGGMLLSSGRIRRSLPLLYNAADTPTKIPDIESKWTHTIDGIDIKELSKFIAAAESSYSYLRLAIEEGKVVFTAEGDIETDREWFRPCDATGDDVHCLYSTDLLRAGLVGSSWGEDLTIRFAENFPLGMTYASADGTLSVKFIVAPRFEHD